MPLIAGDWLALISPSMRDLSANATQWWSEGLAVSNEYYATWLAASPIDRVSLKPSRQDRFDTGKRKVMVHRFLKKSSNLVKTVKKIRPIAFKKNNLYRKIDCNTTYYLTDDLYHLYHDLFYPEIVYLCLRARGPYWQNVAHKTLENTDISKFLRCFVLVTVYIFINLYIIVSF